MEDQKPYKTTEKERAYQRNHYKQNIERYRTYKKDQMKRRRENPEINERIKRNQREWYKKSGRAKRQKEYIERFKINNFFKWRVRLFNMHYLTNYTEQDFELLWNRQKGCCSFTGWELNHKNAHIDHIIPVKKGGTHDISNLRWVVKEVNYGKRDMSDTEYLNVIEAIVRKIHDTNQTTTIPLR